MNISQVLAVAAGIVVALPVIVGVAVYAMLKG